MSKAIKRAMQARRPHHNLDTLPPDGPLWCGRLACTKMEAERCV